MKASDKPKFDPAQIRIRAKSSEEQGEVAARVMSKPEIRAASIIQKFEGDGLDINYLAAELRTQIDVVATGDLGRPEAMLLAQAHTLDSLFSNLARRSHSNMSEGYGEAAERYMRLALKAQSQAVRTIEALCDLKHPKNIAFVAQANISSGLQQVNNGTLPPAGQNQIEQIKLSAGVGNELLPDTRTQGYAGTLNKAMETVGKIDRAANAGRKIQGEAKRI